MPQNTRQVSDRNIAVPGTGISRADWIADTLRTAQSHYEAGHFLEAKLACEQILVAEPAHAAALHRLGVIAFQAGRPDLAVSFIERAIQTAPVAAMHFHLGLVHQATGTVRIAMQSYEAALALDPALAEAHLNLGGLHKTQGNLDSAVRHYRKALDLRTDYAEAHSNLGAALFAQGKSDDAIRCYRLAIAIRPNYADAHLNLGNALFVRHEVDAALAHFRQAVALDHLDVEARNGIASVFVAKGAIDQALDACEQALQIQDNAETKSIIARCIKSLSSATRYANLPNLVARAMDEPWGRPSHFVGACIDLIKRDPAIRDCIERAGTLWTGSMAQQNLSHSPGFESLTTHRLLQCLLRNAPASDLELERVLTATRACLLTAASATAVERHPKALAFFCALARQCFINEYVYAHTDEEIASVTALAARIAAASAQNATIPAIWIAAVAAYVPLHSLDFASALSRRSWDRTIEDVIEQQVREPAMEAGYRATMPVLTRTDDDVSLAVRSQYEQNPYPRWIKSRPAPRPVTLAAALAQEFPAAPVRAPEKYDALDILIAGCGTGQQSIETAQRYVGARVLAVDLSLASLCHAERKTREIGLTNIEYARADLLELGSIERRFDLVESIGVLHHLHDPVAGLRVLVSLLRPGGFVNLGLYSELGRRDVVAARAFIAASGYSADIEGIRRCRGTLLRGKADTPWSRVSDFSDFFVASGCRDLLFHAQEHRFALPDIARVLGEAGLRFIGFSVEERVAAAYAKRYPQDKVRCNLDRWHAFETEYPDTFRGMYQFWAQKID